MGTAREYLNKLKMVTAQVPDKVVQIVYSEEVKIIDLNKEKQVFEKGVDITGGVLGTYSKTSTGIGRGFPKSIGSKFNLFDTGELFNDFELGEVTPYQMFIINNNKKVGLLGNIGVTNFVGLTKENKGILNWEIIYPELLSFINQHI